MNIAMISLDFPPTVGGISAHVYELSKALGKLGHAISVITRKLKHETYPENEYFRTYAVPLKYSNLFYGRQMNAFIRNNLPAIRPDILHIHGMAPLEWHNIENIPLVYTNHTSGYLRRIQKGGWRRMALLKRIFKKPALILAPSRELLEIPFPVTAQKVFIPNGIDSSKYLRNAQHRSSVRNRLSLSENDLVGILTRRLVPKNGVIHLARATRYLRNSRVKLLLIGDGPERNAVEQELARHFAGKYFMLGSKSHDDIIPYYSAADFSVLPSLMEATSISGLEAMASSLPLVGTKVGGIPELVEDGQNGFLCNPADERDLALKIDLLSNQDMRKLGAQSRKRVEEKFDWHRIASQTLDAYRGIV